MSVEPRKPTIWFIFVTIVFSVLGFGLLIPTLPMLVKDINGGNEGATFLEYGGLVSAFALLQFIGSPILGALSDRFGRRRVILIALIGTSIDYIVMANAKTLPWLTPMTWLTVGRCISGVTAGVFATANAYVADVMPPEKRAHGYGLLGAAFGLGFVLGPLLGGWLGSIDLQLPFWFAAGCAALNWLWGFFVLPESLKPENRRDFSFARANPFSALIGLGRFPVVLKLAGAYFIMMLAQMLTYSIWVLSMNHRYHWGTLANGMSLGIAGLCMGLVQGGLVKRIVPRLGEPKAVMIGLSISVCANILYGLATEGWMVYCVIAFGAFGGIGPPALQAFVSRQVPANEQGGVQGMYSGLSSLAGVPAGLCGNVVMNWAINHGDRFPIIGMPFYVAAVLFVIVIFIANWAFRHAPRPAAAPAPAV